ncbi:MAG TPA: LD-carboxypeptidase [Desulfofustis sp.]|jgi:muramoyltetrapeptide carboxypeptidase|nr:LD-carboxypeptidase [Desulfofustis sp. PB-SRB1]HBH29536.1 LD-carboxypeptidase [Desulfofustis sp.]HBH32595.1 LD-carboxypeptidase [Desulfofustis sp.]
MNRPARVPPPLKKGDAIAVITPAGPVSSQERLARGCAILTEMGFEVINEATPSSSDSHLAADDTTRCAQLHRVLRDPAIKAVIAARGGFGTLRLLPHLDFDLISATPTWLIGFSDISILLNVITQRTGIVTLHGPVVSTLSELSSSAHERLYRCITEGVFNLIREPVEILRGGTPVSGVCMGGNLTSLLSLLGTEWFPIQHGAILFLEEVGEPMYRLDRMLTQLAYTGVFANLSGIILGDFSGPEVSANNTKIHIEEFVWERVLELTRPYETPVWGKFPCGHDGRLIAMPIGCQVTMDSARPCLRF